MGVAFVRPYPVAELAQAKIALADFHRNDLGATYALYTAARAALFELDPDAIREPLMPHGDAPGRDKSALSAALDVADTWEGVVAVAATISSLPRLRGFLLCSAWCRYLDAEDPTLDDFKACCRGGNLPGLSVEDTALYALLPALIGLGPELADDVSEAVPASVSGSPAWQMLGLPEDDWGGVDPLDGVAISAECCADAVATVQGAWRDLLKRGAAEGGLLIRRDS